MKPRSTIRAAIASVVCCAMLAVASVATDARVLAMTDAAAGIGSNDGLDAAARGEMQSLITVPTKVTLISDSALAGIRWQGQLGHLTGTRWETRLESCRRISYPSCNGREGYSPRTLTGELNSIAVSRQVRPDELLLVSVGHNDWESRFARDLRTALFAARNAGFTKVGWLVYREDVSYRLPGSAADTLFANYAAMNAELRRTAASGEWPELVLIDYDGFTAGQRTWFSRDGVHLTTTGATAIAQWLSRLIQFDATPALAPPNWGG